VGSLSIGQMKIHIRLCSQSAELDAGLMGNQLTFRVESRLEALNRLAGLSQSKASGTFRSVAPDGRWSWSASGKDSAASCERANRELSPRDPKQQPLPKSYQWKQYCYELMGRVSYITIGKRCA
jgi:hypothetical protein